MSGLPAFPHSLARPALQALFQPATGNTEAFIELRPLRALEKLHSPFTVLEEYEIRDFGRGTAAVERLMAHIFQNKLKRRMELPPLFWRGVWVLALRCRLQRYGGGTWERRRPRELAGIAAEFARQEGAARAADIEGYAAARRGGQDLGRPLYISGAALNRCGAAEDGNALYMIDGARRISAAVLAGKRKIDIWLIVPEEQAAALLRPEYGARVRELLGGVQWFPHYQAMPLLGIPGERTTRRFALMEMERLRGRTVLDFGCNIGQAALQAVQAGARRVVGVEVQPLNLRVARFIARTLGCDNLHFVSCNFNHSDFRRRIDAAVPQRVDYSFFFSVYRTKELTRRDELFRYIIAKTRRGIFFEGHAHPRIDTPEYYQWLFESFGLRFRFLGHSEPPLRPLYYIPLQESGPA